MKQIYLDNAATTKLDPIVLEAMIPYLTENYGNPSSLYEIGINNKLAVNSAREKVAALIGAKPSEIYFTSGGSESDNWVLKTVPKGMHVITSNIEHHAILHSCEWLKNNGIEITYVKVDENGFVNPEDIENAIKGNTYLISIMFANNEIGAIQPIKEIGDIAKKHFIYFHTDAVQAFGHVPINVDDFGIDMLSCSSHKINGPKGVGALYIREGIFLPPYIHGGSQENNMRAGTENVPGIVGFGVAAELANNRMDDYNATTIRLMNRLIAGIKDIDDIHLNGSDVFRLTNNLNIRVGGVRGEELETLLDMYGCYISTGSACNSSNNEPSHVLKAIGLTDDEANSSIRITISSDLSNEDIDEFVDILKSCIAQLRSR